MRPERTASQPDLQALAGAFGGTFSCCDDAPFALLLLSELAKGKPLSPGGLVATADRPRAEVMDALTRWPTVQRDDRGRVEAFSGLSVVPASHHFTVGGRQLYTWCAWDALFLPTLLGESADVRSRCPVTGAELRLTVTPEGVEAVEPEALWVSFPPPTSASTADITGTFCCHVHFLAHGEAAEWWSDEHPGAMALKLNDAFDLGRLATRGFRDDANSNRCEDLADHPAR